MKSANRSTLAAEGLPTYTTEDELRALFDLPANQYGLGIPDHVWQEVNGQNIPADFASYLTEKMAEKGVRYRQLKVGPYNTSDFALRGAVEISHGLFFVWHGYYVRPSQSSIDASNDMDAANRLSRFKVTGRFVDLVGGSRAGKSIDIDVARILFAGTGDERQGLGTSEWVRTYVMGDLTWVKTMEKTTIRTEGVNLPYAVPDDLSNLTRWLISRVDGRVASLTGKKVGKSSLLSKTKSFEAPRDALTRNVAMVATDFTSAYRELFADPALLVEQYAVIESGHAVSEPIVLRFCALGRELMEALEADYPYLKCEVPAGVEVSHYHNYLARHISEQGHAVLNLLAEYVADESNAAPLTEYEVYGSVMAVGVLMAGAVNDSRSQVYIANAVKYFKDKLHALQGKE